ncbi:hypothetical protein DUNSADRAFT_3711 [Dunaliella salina]|uniref:Uncharacterized protein n=1 Tax=Dunaliella salina TaxID=3046 RepID=A0ABQ7FV80_DUNSA|nr:hypothetical protein DUNSADRAFT_3711 [Dunaliella salina]|eukprot:KAF5826296.1 hypothetical protein DUNSADRAFT_3711 [Dunaliella salina]
MSKAQRGKDPFAFPNGTDENLPLLASISKKLQHPPKSKDALLKTLKQLSSTLEAGPQETSALGGQGEPIANSLLDSAILGHADKDVKLSAACCIVQLLRIYAPETPYGDEQLRDIFKLLCWVFQRLAQPSAPTFEICQSILQQTEQVKLYMLLLDLNDLKLTTQLFESLLGAARTDNLEAIELSVLEMLAGLVEELEADTLSQELLEVLLKALLGIGYDPAANKLVQRLLQRCEEQLHTSLQRFSTALLTGTTRSSLQPECMRVISELYQCTPQVLLPVLPHLHAELEALDAAQRLAATELLVTLLCVPESDISEHFPKLAGATLQRYKDVCPNIRVHMLERTPQLAALTKNASVREQVRHLLPSSILKIGL